MLPNNSTINSLLYWGKIKLKHFPTPLIESEILLANTLQQSKSYLFANPKEIVPKNKIINFKNKINRRIKNEPIAYITNSKEFYCRNFYVDKNVLIPRPESEGIIDIIKTQLIKRGINPINALQVIDIGTGSGCLAITLSLELSLINTNIRAIDISPMALKIARKNWRELHTNSKNHVSFLQKDILKSKLSKKFDIIISNPPYIKTKEIPQLSKDVSDFEPISALSGGLDGLLFYRRLATLIKSSLTTNGFAILEINSDLVEETKAIFTNEYGLELLNDMSNKPRYLILTSPQ